ncbi:MAG TPA: protein kinase, partial [Polyangiaceae bacterium]|nr:protein kinase [Polyangiaceae bacterium]
MLSYTRLSDAVVGDAELLTMALEGVVGAARLSHPNVAQIFELGREGDELYVVGEFLNGLSLEALFERCGRALSTQIYARVLCDALAGLHAAHEQRDKRGAPLGLVHADLSAESVVVTACLGETKVRDLGSARVAPTLYRQRPLELERRVARLAPEQVRGAPDAAGPGVDVFAVGLLLFRALAGRPLWAGQRPTEILERLDAGRIPPTREAAPHAPAELVAICDRALAPRPADRYPTALAFRQALEGYLERSGASPKREQIGHVVEELFGDEQAKLSEALLAHRAACPAPDDMLLVQPSGELSAPDEATAPPAEPPAHPYRGRPRAPRPPAADLAGATSPSGRSSA